VIQLKLTTNNQIEVMNQNFAQAFIKNARQTQKISQSSKRISDLLN